MILVILAFPSNSKSQIILTYFVMCVFILIFRGKDKVVEGNTLPISSASLIQLALVLFKKLICVSEALFDSVCELHLYHYEYTITRIRFVKDLAPYLPTMIPGLKQSLLDPVPEVRTASAKALGAMVRGMGEKGFEELVPWLMQTLTAEQSSVDRSGAAQGRNGNIIHTSSIMETLLGS